MPLTSVAQSGRFDPRAREGRDEGEVLHFDLRSMFRSTRPRRARRASTTARRLALIRFDPRAREGRDTRRRGSCLSVVEFRSTRPRRARRDSNNGLADNADVSIHAPAKGATRLEIKQLRFGIVSIHAPAKGATQSGAVPRRHRQVSIHAPAKGATGATNGRALVVLFRSTRPRRARPDFVLDHIERLPVSIHAPAKGATPIDSALCPDE